MSDNSNDNNKDKGEDSNYFKFDKIEHPIDGDIN